MKLFVLCMNSSGVIYARPFLESENKCSIHMICVHDTWPRALMLSINISYLAKEGNIDYQIPANLKNLRIQKKHVVRLHSHLQEVQESVLSLNFRFANCISAWFAIKFWSRFSLNCR